MAAYIRNSEYDVKLYNAENPAEGEVNGRIDSSVELLDSNALFNQNMEDDNFIVWNEVKEVLENYKPDIVGLTVMSVKYRPAIKISKIVKEVLPSTITVWGGPHCSADGGNTLKNNDCIDYVIKHEGEKAFDSLVREIHKSGVYDDIPNLIYRENGQIQENGKGAYIKDLDALPFPARNIDVFQERYPYSTLNNIMASRGCPYQCAFCNSAQVWGRKVRARSVENIVNEIRHLQSKYGVTKIHFCDDTFTINPKRTIEFCKALQGAKLKVGWSCTTRLNVLTDDVCEAMKDSGIIYISCGIESGSARILKEIEKGLTLDDIKKGVSLLDKYNIDWHAYFMVGFPTESVEDIKMTRKIWDKIKPTSIYLSVYTPYPGSKLYDVTKQLGLLPDNPDWSSYSHQNLNNHFVKNIPADDFKEILKDMFAFVDDYNASFYNLLRKAYKRKRYYLNNISELFSVALQKLKKVMGKK